jgi:hypothetical protein
MILTVWLMCWFINLLSSQHYEVYNRVTASCFDSHESSSRLILEPVNFYKAYFLGSQNAYYLKFFSFWTTRVVGSCPPQLEVKATPGQKTIDYYPWTSSLQTKRTVSNKHFGTPKSTLDESSLVLRLAWRWLMSVETCRCNHIVNLVMLCWL